MHNTHELASISDMKDETYNEWIKISNDENLIANKIEENINKIEKSKELLDFISNEPLNFLQKLLKDHSSKYNNKINNSYNICTAKLKKNLKKAIENNNKIKQCAKLNSKISMVNAAELINDQILVEDELGLISDRFHNSIKNENLIAFDAHVNERFKIDANKLIENEEVQMENMDEESKIWSLHITKNDSDKWEIVIKRVDESDINYFAKIESLSENVTWKDLNKILKIKAKSEVKVLNSVKINLNENNKANSDIEIKLNLWKISKDNEEYIESSRSSLKDLLQEFINNL